MTTVAAKELLQLRRDRFTFGLMLGIPAIQLVLFGYAIRSEVLHIKTAVVDQDQTSMSRSLTRSLAESRAFDLVGQLESTTHLEEGLRAGRYEAVLVIPKN